MSKLSPSTPRSPFGSPLAPPRDANETGRLDPAQTQLALSEVAALRLELDLGADVGAVGDHPLVQRFRAPVATGDHLRLPQVTQLEGLEVRQALARVLSVDLSRGAASEALAVREAGLHRVLAAIAGAMEHVQERANAGDRGA